jgi:hypothetical protein
VRRLLRWAFNGAAALMAVLFAGCVGLWACRLAFQPRTCFFREGKMRVLQVGTARGRLNFNRVDS